MDTLPIHAALIDALKEAFVALNRHERSAFVALYDQQVERVIPIEFPGGGTFRGLEVVQEHLRQSLSKWAEGSCEPRRFLVAGDRIIVYVDVHVRLKDEAEWRDGLVVDAFTFRDGRITEWRSFADEAQALAWAGLAGPGEAAGLKKTPS